MTLKITERLHLRQLVEQDIIAVGSQSTSCEFNDFITKNYPWMESSIDWNSIGDSMNIDAAKVDKFELYKFFTKTTLSRYDLTTIVYSTKEPCMIVEFVNLAKHFDDFIFAITQCYFVGTSFYNSLQWIWHYDDFVEFKMSDKLLLTGKIA